MAEPETDPRFLFSNFLAGVWLQGCSSSMEKLFGKLPHACWPVPGRLTCPIPPPFPCWILLQLLRVFRGMSLTIPPRSAELVLEKRASKPVELGGYKQVYAMPKMPQISPTCILTSCSLFKIELWPLREVNFSDLKGWLWHQAGRR